MARSLPYVPLYSQHHAQAPTPGGFHKIPSLNKNALNTHYVRNIVGTISKTKKTSALPEFIL